MLFSHWESDVSEVSDAYMVDTKVDGPQISSANLKSANFRT
jgi:hypothetical protein